MSPLLFNIFIDPYLQALEQQTKGYIRQNGSTIKVSAFVDDIALIAGSLEDLKTMIKITENFFNFYGMTLSIETAEQGTKTKTVISSNTPIEEPVMYWNGKNQVKIPILPRDQSY